MNIYDISLPISPELVTWPGDPKVHLESLSQISQGAAANVTHISFCVHSGTHIDAPVHFLEDGFGVDAISLKDLMGRVYVQYFPDADEITEDLLRKTEIPPRTRRIIFKTRNSQIWEQDDPNRFRTDYVALTPDAAQYLVERGIKLVGIDYLSIAPYHAPEIVHRILLQGGVTILEGLNLVHVTQGRYTLYCLPLKIIGADGAPARAILVGI